MSWGQQIEKNKVVLLKQVDKIKQVCADSLEKVEEDRAGCPVFWLKKDQAIHAMKIIKENSELAFEFLSDLTAYDDTDGADESRGRFVVVYQLFSPQYKTRIRVKVRTLETQPVQSAVSLWEAANWAEREVFDMFGIRFDQHPDLRRILMDVRWEGHPLRKDYYWRKYQLFNDPEAIPMDLLKEDLK